MRTGIGRSSRERARVRIGRAGRFEPLGAGGWCPGQPALYAAPVHYDYQHTLAVRAGAVQLIEKLRLPILFLSGRADEIVPAHMMTQVGRCGAGTVLRS